jgi:outer membrane receptor protein involved in Fe transport
LCAAWHFFFPQFCTVFNIECNIVETLETNHQSLDLLARYISNDGVWSLGLGVRNATDEFYYESRDIFSAYDMVFGQPVRPRTVYATFEYNLGAR